MTIDILRAPAAPAPVDLSAVTKSIGELNKAVAELKASAAELKASVGELKTSAAELNASVGELKSSAATKDEVGTLGKSIQELRDAVGKAATAAVQAAATRVQAQSKESSTGDASPAPQTPPPPAEKQSEGSGSLTPASVTEAGLQGQAKPGGVFGQVELAIDAVGLRHDPHQVRFDRCARPGLDGLIHLRPVRLVHADVVPLMRDRLLNHGGHHATVLGAGLVGASQAGSTT